MDRMHAAMMMLGRTFPLRQCLNGHIFALIVENAHRSWRAALESSSEEEEESDEEADPEKCKQKEREETVLQFDTDDPPRCSRCNKRIQQVQPARMPMFQSETASKFAVAVDYPF